MHFKNDSSYRDVDENKVSNVKLINFRKFGPLFLGFGRNKNCVFG